MGPRLRMFSHKKKSVLIVGCGDIAGGLEMVQGNSKTFKFPITHAGAFTSDYRFSLDACVEPDREKRKNFMRYWNIPFGFDNLIEVKKGRYQFDIICICSPTTQHYESLALSIKMKPKLIFAEKPLTKSVINSKKIIKKIKENNIQLIVNHTRRWDESIQKLKLEIKKELWGDLRCVNAIYTKGVINNGTHLIDLFYNLFGKISILSVGLPIYDHFEDDPTVPCVLEGPKNLPINISCGNAADYAIFEIQFVFSRSTLCMEDGGLLWKKRNVEDNTVFPGYKTLSKPKSIKGKNLKTFQNAVDNIYHAIESGSELLSTGDSAILSQILCEKIKEKGLKYYKKRMPHDNR